MNTHSEKGPIVLVGSPGVGKTTFISLFSHKAPINIDHLFMYAPHFKEYTENTPLIQKADANKSGELRKLVGQVESESLELKGKASLNMQLQGESTLIDGGLITAYGYASFYHRRGLIEEPTWKSYSDSYLTYARELYADGLIINITDSPHNILGRITARRKIVPEREFEKDYTPDFIQGVSNGIQEGIQMILDDPQMEKERRPTVINVPLDTLNYGDTREGHGRRQLVQYLKRSGVENFAKVGENTARVRRFHF